MGLLAQFNTILRIKQGKEKEATEVGNQAAQINTIAVGL
jgi:hypothetical protein